MFVVQYARANPAFVSDFDHVWAATRALLEGRNPYAAIGPEREFAWRWPLYYPLPALLIVAPTGLLGVVAARALFMGMSVALLAWGATRDGFARLPLFASMSFFTAIQLCQWSPLLTFACFVPMAAWLGIAKPNLGAAIVASAPSNGALLAAIAGSGALLLASFALEPGWLTDWLANVREAPHFRAPVTRVGGVLLLLALFRWRRPEARLLLVLSVVPQTPTFYDVVLLFVVTRTLVEAGVLAALSWVMFFMIGAQGPFADFAAWGDAVGRATVFTAYLPALVFVLRRPNEGEVPAVITRMVHLVRPRRRTASA